MEHRPTHPGLSCPSRSLRELASPDTAKQFLCMSAHARPRSEGLSTTSEYDLAISFVASVGDFYKMQALPIVVHVAKIRCEG